MSNTFGHELRVTTFGESHGSAVGAIIDGYPVNIALCENDIQPQLNRRRPGQSDITTPRDEADIVRIISGVQNGRTLGTPITLIVDNKDTRPKDYARENFIPRPSHADYSYMMKYGTVAKSGGGRASARETVSRVAAGAAAELFLRGKYNIDIVAYVSTVGNIRVNHNDIDITTISREAVDQNIVRCPSEQVAQEMSALIKKIAAEGDSIGGIITCVCRGVPPGWGEPVFDKLEAKLAQAMMSIPASKGFEIGSGFSCAAMQGSEHNDIFIKKPFDASLGTLTNRSGGVQGGISNGEPIYFNIAFKPTATISKEQTTADYDGNETVLKSTGRHDPCVVPRAVPVVEAMTALVLMDAALAQLRHSQK